ncbi:MAG: 3-hydroxyacyl-CoA dehydrogenase [Dehalococcoidia bacterium]|nr:3-hydroxyacyl-CoA dehydrogenase [Dehalococcoidia bacterium]HCV00922.1 3-hydroxyacyl-CoA dehydrogenase [Dehalococcoidia bacterium]|tara:strand:+ start:5010 stop:5984 length:975 start_codon:yes stop_codon:yes gene_type:complete
MAGRLEGKVAIVTGAGRGIGKGEALLLAEQGARVVVNDLGGSPDGEGADSSPADEVVAEIVAGGGKAVANYDSVASMEGGERIVQTALDNFGSLDILINNAGILRDRMVFNMTEAEWDSVVAVHLKGHFTTTKYASLVFRQQRSGRIVNTSSESGLGNMGQANYAAAKEGIVGLTRTCALDLGRYGVTVNAIRPRAGTRLTLSPELREAMRRARASRQTTNGNSDNSEGNDANSGQAISQMDVLEPEMIAPLVVFLCTEAAANVNGRDFVVGGDEVSLMTIPTKQATIHREGGWDLDSLERVFPRVIGTEVSNPAPAQTPKTNN